MTKTIDDGFRPGEYAYYDIEELGIGAWCPTTDGSGKATQVHMFIRLKHHAQEPFVMRFKSPETIGVLIEQLVRYRKEVWPDAAPIG